MTVSRPTVDVRFREDLIQNFTPEVFYNTEEQERLPGFFQVAPWLPVLWVEEATKEAFVISKGKVVALDTRDNLVPAGLRTKLVTVNLTYTANDVTWKTENLVTGLPVTAAVSYTPLQVAQALIERGLVLRSDVSAVSAAQCIPAFISLPLGIAPYDVWCSAKAADGFSRKLLNWERQIGVAVFRKANLRIPLLTSGVETSDDFDADALNTAGTQTYAAGDLPSAGEYWNAANISQVARYENILTSTSPVVALGLARQPIASDTDRTPITCDTEGVLVRLRSGPAQIVREGDYFIDKQVGILFLHTDTWATLVADTAVFTLSYHYYAAATASSEKWVYVDGRVKPGSFLGVDADSNFTLVDPASVGAQNWIGRVSQFLVEPRNLLETTLTPTHIANAPKTMKMPGTATKGFSDAITLRDDPVADTLVILRLDVR